MDDIAPESAVMIRGTERILMVIGLTLLAVWGVLRVHRLVASRAAIARYHSEEAAIAHTVPPPVLDPRSGAIVDFRLWSIKRVEAYKDSITKKTDEPLAILHIPKIDLEVPVFNDTDDLTLNRGVGRITGTAHVGQRGNLGIAGHRDGFFRGLQNIVVGDLIEIESGHPGHTDQYVVSKIQVVRPEDTYVLDSTPAPTVTLVTCFPFYYVGNAPQRFIVTASITNSGQRDKSGEGVSISTGKINTKNKENK